MYLFVLLDPVKIDRLAVLRMDKLLLFRQNAKDDIYHIRNKLYFNTFINYDVRAAQFEWDPKNRPSTCVKKPLVWAGRGYPTVPK